MEDLKPYTVILDMFGFQCRCLNLERLIHVKRAAGRPKILLNRLIVQLERFPRARLSGPNWV